MEILYVQRGGEAKSGLIILGDLSIDSEGPPALIAAENIGEVQILDLPNRKCTGHQDHSHPQIAQRDARSSIRGNKQKRYLEVAGSSQIWLSQVEGSLASDHIEAAEQSSSDYCYRKLFRNFVAGPTLIDVAQGDQVRVGVSVNPSLSSGPISCGSKVSP